MLAAIAAQGSGAEIDLDPNNRGTTGSSGLNSMSFNMFQVSLASRRSDPSSFLVTNPKNTL